MKRPKKVQMESIIDQLRVHDGKLFQNEIVLTVYVDLKRMVLNNILIALSTPGGLKPFLTWTEELETDLVKNLLVTEDLFQRALAVYANELRSEVRPFGLRQALKAMFHRLCGDPFVVDKQILSLDPIKQDFILREVFRRSLSEGLNLTDTLVQLPPPTSLTRPVTPPRSTTPPRPMSPLTPQAFALPDAQEAEAQEAQEAQDDMPDSISISARSVAKSIARSVARSVAPSVAKSVARSVARKPATVVPDTNSVASSSTMTMKRPNIRRVIIDDDASTVFTSRK